jgi:AraC family transcriptional regulator, positive regulator of tynA and feaB
MELTTGTVKSDTATSVLTDNLCNLLALASATDVEPGRLQPELQIEALLAYCRQNLHDPELTPQRAADHVRISVRTLHSRFKLIGKSFGRWVLDNRLDACRNALRDVNQNAFSISEIAYRWGFNDLSYFNKAFRARFDCSPREWRDCLNAMRKAPPLLVP